MKKKLICGFLLLFVMIMMVGSLIWYATPTTLTKLSPEDVEEISIFYAGNTVYITDKEEIRQYIDHWNDIHLKKEHSSKGYSGFTFIVYMLLRAGTTTSFVVNSENTVSMGGYFYTTTDQKIEFDQMFRLFDHFN